MRFFVYFLSALFIFTTVSSKEFRIDFSDEGMKLLKKRGFGKKTSYTNGKDDKGWYLKAEANDSATGLGMEIDKDLLKEMPFLNISFKIEKDFEIIDQNTFEVVTSNKISVGPPFYNKLILPFLIPFLVAMAIGPNLNWVKSDFRDKFYMTVFLLISFLLSALIIKQFDINFLINFSIFKFF